MCFRNSSFALTLLALFGKIEIKGIIYWGNFTRQEDQWQKSPLVLGNFYSFSTSGRPLSSSTELMLDLVLQRLTVCFLLAGITQTFQCNYCCYFLPLEMKCFFLRKENLPKFKRKIRYSDMIKHDETHQCNEK